MNIREKIELSIKNFESEDLTLSAINLFNSLGYNTERQISLNKNPIFQEFEDIYIKNNPNYNNFSYEKARTSEFKYIDLLFQITSEEIESKSIYFNNNKGSIYNSYLFLTIELKKLNYKEEDLLAITKELNKLFPTYLFILFKYGKNISFSIINRRQNKKDESKDVLSTVSLIKNISIINPLSEHVDKMIDLSLDKILKRNKQIDNFDDLHNTFEFEFEDDAEIQQVIKDESINDDLVKLYLKEIGNIALLSSKEEIEYAKMIDAGKELRKNRTDLNIALGYTSTDEELSKKLNIPLHKIKEIGKESAEGIRKLTISNLRLVVNIAKKYIGRGLEFSDLIQEGNLGLIRAVEKFSYKKGNKFSTYATWWIRQSITRAIADKGRTIRVPIHIFETLNKLKKATRKLTQELGRKPTEEEISKEMVISVEKYREIIDISKHTVSLDNFMNEISENISIISNIEDKKAEKNFEEIEYKYLIDDINNTLEKLSEREKEIIILRYGLNSNKEHSLQEIGNKFNLTRERIRQIESKALKKLSNSRKLKSYLYEEYNNLNKVEITNSIAFEFKVPKIINTPQDFNLFDQGNSYLNQKKYDLAIQSFKKSLKVAYNIDCYNSLGITYYYLKEYKLAMEYFKKALCINNENIESKYLCKICENKISLTLKAL